MLYALRYEKSRPANVAELRRFVGERFDMRGSLGLVDGLLAYAGAGVRSCDLFGANASVFSKLAGSVSRSVAGVQNVYTQHQPLLTGLLDALARGKLPRTTFPFVGAEPPPGKLSTVVVFIVGGLTFEEAAKVAAINAGTLQVGGTAGAGAGAGGAGAYAPPFRVVIGGTTVHNSKSFLAELQRISGDADLT
jgi:vacuolar protein sorting-associated protein 45